MAGWFLAATVAEWRVAGPSSPVGRASLVRRHRRDYLARWAYRLPPILALVAVAVAAVDVASWGRLRDQALVECSLLAVATVVVHRLVRSAALRTLSRPQPAGLPPALLAADEAVRYRSLHVLQGADVALQGLLLSWLLYLHPDVHTGMVPTLPLLMTACLGYVIGVRTVPWDRAEAPYRAAVAVA